MKPVLALIFVWSAVAAAQTAPSFTRDLQPVFGKYCLDCHAHMVKMGSLDLETHAGVMQGGNHGTIVVPGKAEESRLFLMASHKMKPIMPMDGRLMAAGELALLRDWINAGAKPDGGAGEAVRPTSAKRPGVKPTAPVKPTVTVKPQLFSLAMNPAGTMFAAGGFGSVRLFDAQKSEIGRLDGHMEMVRSLQFSRDGKLLAAAGGQPGVKGQVKIWNVAERQLLATINGHKDCIYAVAISPDGTQVATASYDKMIYLWEAATGKQIRVLKDHVDAVYALEFSRDGKLLVSGSADRSVKVWNPATGERLYTLAEPTDGVNAIALSPDGKFVAAAGQDKTIRTWELGEKGGTLRQSLIAHEDAILQLVWTPDGTRLLSASADKSIKVFRAADLQEMQIFAGQPDWTSGLVVAPDSKSAAATFLDGSLQIYQLSKPGEKAP